MTPRSWQLPVVISLVYAAVTLVMTYPLVNLAALATACYGGDARLIIWTLAWDNHALLARLPLFAANMFFPAASSLDYAEHHFGISVFTLPVYALTRNPILGYNIVWLSAWILNGLSMHALVWHYTRRHLAALVSGVMFAFSFYNMHHAIGHLQLIWTWLVPLSLLLFERWHERPTAPRAAVWAVAMTLQVLSCWYVGVMVLLATSMLVVWRHALDVRGQWTRRIVTMLLIAAAGTAIVWPFAAHYRSLQPAGLAEMAANSADWKSYLVPPENTLAGQWWLTHAGPGPRWIWGEQTLFVGWTAIALAIVGAVALLWSKTWRSIGVYPLISAVALALSFGPHWPPDAAKRTLFDVFMRLPALGGFRAPGRFGMLVLLGLSVLAGNGIARLQRRFGRAATPMVIVLLPVMLAEWFVVGNPMGRPQPVPTPGIFMHRALKVARAYVVLPDYGRTREWYLEPDYLLFSTATWTRIVNGYGRSEPPDHLHVISHMKAFPGPNNARTMRELGVEYVVLRSAAYPDRAAEILAGALSSPEYELIAQMDADYLFRVRPVSSVR
jgi:hypothetical protein